MTWIQGEATQEYIKDAQIFLPVNIQTPVANLMWGAIIRSWAITNHVWASFMELLHQCLKAVTAMCWVQWQLEGNLSVSFPPLQQNVVLPHPSLHTACLRSPLQWASQGCHLLQSHRVCRFGWSLLLLEVNWKSSMWISFFHAPSW